MELAGSSEPAKVLPTLTQLLALSRDFGLIIDSFLSDEARHYVKQITKVTKAVTNDGKTMDKARVHYVVQENAQSQYKDPGYIDTDWTNTPGGMACALQAKGLVGERVLFHQLNDPDPTGEVSKGFRRLVWVTPLWQWPAAEQGKGELAEPEPTPEEEPEPDKDWDDEPF
jgi:hypothetical protein